MRQQGAIVGSNVNIGMAVQLALSCSAAGAVALLVSDWLGSYALSPQLWQCWLSFVVWAWVC